MVAINIWLTVQVFLRDRTKKTHQNTLTEKNVMYKYYLANIKKGCLGQKISQITAKVAVVHNI